MDFIITSYLNLNETSSGKYIASEAHNVHVVELLYRWDDDVRSPFQNPQACNIFKVQRQSLISFTLSWTMFNKVQVEFCAWDENQRTWYDVF